MSADPAARRRVLRTGGASIAGATLVACSALPRTAARPHIVLVHGAWHGAWCWAGVAPLLRARGHGVTAIDLPGRWRSPAAQAAITADDYVQAVLQVLRTVPTPAVLVGHSLGGASISLAAEAAPERVHRLVYLTAFLVPPGQTVGALAGADRASRIPSAVRRDAATGSSAIDPARAREVFFHDCTDEDVRMAQQLLSPEPGVMGRTALRLTPERFGSVDRAFIECLQDRAITLDAQRAMQVALPCRQVLALDSSHSPFFSHPGALADLLSQLA